MKAFYCTLIAMSLLTANTSAMAQSPLGDFTDQTDIGSPKWTGAVGYDTGNQEYTISGAGTNMWFGSDQCHFVWNKMRGDFILRTRMQFIGEGKVPHRK